VPRRWDRPLGSALPLAALRKSTIKKLLVLDHVRLPGLSGGAWFPQTDFLFLLCAIVVVASLILGGGTRGGFLSDAILQFVSIPLLLVALWRLFDVPLTKQMRLALSFCAVIVLIPLVQLIPLPPGLWTALPNREVSVETFKLLNAQVPWMPLSVSPRETWLSALSLIPPVGIFIATVLLSYRARRWLSLVFLAVGVISVFLGLLQVAQGQQSALRFFAFTNWNEAVGFFANRNHFAALIYALILFAAAWAIQAVASSWEERRRRRYDTASIAAIIVAFTLLVRLWRVLVSALPSRPSLCLGLSRLAFQSSLWAHEPPRAAN
jgi:hypothetical protein